MIGRRQPSPNRMIRAGHDAIAKPDWGRGASARGPRASQRRIFLAAAIFAGCFSLVGARLVGLAITGGDGAPRVAYAQPEGQLVRPDILDRNGDVMATDISVASLFADARHVIDPEEATAKLVSVLPGLDADEVVKKLSSGRAFNWIKRDLTPKQHQAVHDLGIAGLEFRRERKRVYPNGATAANVLGLVNIDNHGIAGMERYVDRNVLGEKGEPKKPVVLSIDVAVQHALRDELQKGMKEFSAKAAVGIIMDIHTGEVMGLSSLPDFDPNDPMAVSADARFNRATLGVYELGSVFKAVTMAAALNSGLIDPNAKVDATKPMKVGRFTISDYHAENKKMTLPEIFMHSSNIGTAKIALEIGGDVHREYLKRFGLLEKPEIELPEAGAPLLPARWSEITNITTSYGHGIAVTPLQVVSALSAIVNGGTRVTPTLVRRDTPQRGARVISEGTSRDMRWLLRLVVEEGTGKNADVVGYPVMGKTGTAEKPENGGYAKHKLITSFVSAFPANKPRYAMIIMFDEPKGTKKTYGYATAGWNAAPVTARVVKRVAPLLDIEPEQPERSVPEGAQLVSYQFHNAR
ncbi:cell division protein FtsI (penicillin-binding protein 3) [Parvibaculum indicum]|uniref:peptidoglycan D,D-transpeptidase FtsI family protein n=1 Tax=Parvibaculum indicum TaxID=562969 RepID=UPI00141FCBCF|nr:penicillin-binding protein 2 [Parvibaculum indicum]NIJ40995.1 cell division protein FtsI (penicillin-binding protein 3) [Parvibaculum indicum]